MSASTADSDPLAPYLVFREVYFEVTILEALLSGIYTALFSVTIYAMVFRRTRTHARAHNIPLYVAVITMYLLSMLHLACRWYMVKQAFINHGQTPDSTVEFILVNPPWLAIIGAATLVTNSLIADCILIWRCWTVWGRSIWVVVLPVLCTLGGTATGYASVAEQARFAIHPELAQRNTFVDFATPYFSLSLVTTVLCTCLIVTRILLISRQTNKHLASGVQAVGNRRYSKAIEVIVESALLYSVTLIVFLPFLVNNLTQDAYPQTILTQMTGFAPTLILARVSFGLSRSPEGWSGRSPSQTGNGSSLMFDTTEKGSASPNTSPISDRRGAFAFTTSTTGTSSTGPFDSVVKVDNV